MQKPRTRIIFQVDEPLNSALKAESARTGAPISEIIRRAIAAALSNTPRPSAR